MKLYTFNIDFEVKMRLKKFYSIDCSFNEHIVFT